MRTGFMQPMLLAAAAALSACGGGDAPLFVAVDGGPAISTPHASIILTGEGSVPAGSSCPQSNEYIIIGSLGPHELAYSNATTHAEGPVFDLLWVCNSEGGKVMHWQSNPIELAPGANTITVTMSAGGRHATDTVTVTRSAA